MKVEQPEGEHSLSDDGDLSMEDHDVEEEDGSGGDSKMPSQGWC